MPRPLWMEPEPTIWVKLRAAGLLLVVYPLLFLAAIIGVTILVVAAQSILGAAVDVLP